MGEPDYKAKVLEVYGSAECEYSFNTTFGIRWSIFVDGIGYLCGSYDKKKTAWYNAYLNLKQQGKI